jgi:hypothetical protein
MSSLRTNAVFLAVKFAASLLLFSTEPRAQTDLGIAYEGSILDLPAVSSGWERNLASDGIVLQKIFLPDTSIDRPKKGAALILISKPLEANGAFADAFQRFVDTSAVMQKERPLTKDEGQTINNHPIIAHLYCCRGPNDIYMQMRVAGIDAGKRRHFVRLVTFNLNKADEKEAADIFQGIVRALRPTAADRAFAMTPSATPDTLKGVYKTLKTGIRPNVFGGTDFYSENRLMVFNGQGLFSTEIPLGGQDIAAHCNAKPKDCGFYRLKGGGLLGGGVIEIREIENDYGMMSRSEEPISIRSGEVRIGETAHTKVPPLPAGTRLNGSWRALSASSGQGAFTSGGFVSEKTLVLTSDGRFERTNFTSVNSSVESGGARTSVTAGGKRPVEKGRYVIEGHGIRLTGDDGKVTNLSFFMPIADSDEVLIIDGGNFRKQAGGK